MAAPAGEMRRDADDWHYGPDTMGAALFGSTALAPLAPPFGITAGGASAAATMPRVTEPGIPTYRLTEEQTLLRDAVRTLADERVAPRAAEIDRTGEFLIKVKKRGLLYDIWYANHPFDVVGWDGCDYPYAISIHDFEPITGRVHQPPPVHQQFDGHNFVICSFVPRLFDYHPQSIPAP